MQLWVLSYCFKVTSVHLQDPWGRQGRRPHSYFTGLEPVTCPAGQPQGWDFGSGFPLLGPCLSTLSEVTLQGLWTALWSFLSRSGFCQGVRGLLESSVWAVLSQTLPGGTVGSAWGIVL